MIVGGAVVGKDGTVDQIASRRENSAGNEERRIVTDILTMDKVSTIVKPRAVDMGHGSIGRVRNGGLVAGASRARTAKLVIGHGWVGDDVAGVGVERDLIDGRKLVAAGVLEVGREVDIASRAN